MATAQSAINQMRIQLGETDVANSRWGDDPELLFYLNRGRTEFAKTSQSLKTIFEQTTTIGATLAGSSRSARYILDPTLWDIDNIYWDGSEVEVQGTGEWEDATGIRDMTEQGLPYLYRRIGDAIDLFFSPNAAKLLEVHATILTTDLATLATLESQLKDDQLQAAIDYGTAMALGDDDRDPSMYMAKFQESSKKWRKKVHLKGARQVNVKRSIY